jgi:hypothetical protein
MQPMHAQAEGDLASERARFKRIILAWQDLEEARQSLSRLLGSNGKAPPHEAEDEDVRAALLTSVVVAYGRLFARSRPSASVPGQLPERFAADLDPLLRPLHKRLLNLRNEEFAHSDAAVAELKIAAFPHDHGGVLSPEARILRKHSVDHHDLVLLDDILNRVHAYLYDEMLRLYPILTPHGDF